MSKNDHILLADSKKHQTAVEKIPIIARGAVSDRAKETLNEVSSGIPYHNNRDLILSFSRSRDLSKKNVYQQTPFSMPSWVKGRRDGTLGRQ